MSLSLQHESAARAPAWPTVAVAAAVYGGWAALTAAHDALPFAVTFACGAALSALHGSLQHETIHGHPTRWPAMNAALGWLPLGLWLPYAIYRDEHLRHHDDAILTEPGRDPESKFVTRAEWLASGPLGRAILAVNATLAGRLLIGPALALAVFAIAETRRLVRGEAGRRAIWAGHALGVAAVLGWAVGLCGMPLAEYALTWTYGGLSLTLLRSYAEHAAAADPARRTAVVEAEAPLGFLFLHNNLHVLHHARPELPWFALPRAWRAEREALLARGGPAYRGYREIARRFLFRPVHAPAHPFV
jgi:fatty acid desaturase